MRILFSVLVCATPRPYSLKSSTPCLVKCNVSGLNLAECFTTLYWCEVNETKNERRNVSVAQADAVCGTGCPARLWSIPEHGQSRSSAFALTEALSLWTLITPSRVSFFVMREEKIRSLSLPYTVTAVKVGGTLGLYIFFFSVQENFACCCLSICVFPFSSL